MKVAVVGSRTFHDYKALESALNRLKDIKEIASGGAKGADKLAEKYALDNSLKITVFYPDWRKYGKRAGLIRNRYIIDECDMCIAFWDGKSKGTVNSINIAKKQNKKVIVIRTDKACKEVTTC